MAQVNIELDTSFEQLTESNLITIVNDLASASGVDSSRLVILGARESTVLTIGVFSSSFSDTTPALDIVRSITLMTPGVLLDGVPLRTSPVELAEGDADFKTEMAALVSEVSSPLLLFPNLGDPNGETEEEEGHPQGASKEPSQHTDPLDPREPTQPTKPSNPEKPMTSQKPSGTRNPQPSLPKKPAGQVKPTVWSGKVPQKPAQQKAKPNVPSSKQQPAVKTSKSKSEKDESKAAKSAKSPKGEAKKGSPSNEKAVMNSTRTGKKTKSSKNRRG